MVDNSKKVRGLLKFESEDDFYHVQIIKRKKEHKELGSNSLIVKTYYLKSLDHMDKIYPEIVSLCNFHNARGCINLNRRSFERVAFHTLIKVTNQIMNKDFKSVKDAYNSVCGAHSSESEKKWIIDIDRKDNYEHGIWLSDKLVELNPNPGSIKLIEILDTKNGYHLITRPFDIQKSNTFVFDEIHKDNPTILYIP